MSLQLTIHLKKTACFYQLLNYTNSSGTYIYSLVFEANAAERGGYHIYGVNMKADCAVAYVYM